MDYSNTLKQIYDTLTGVLVFSALTFMLMVFVFLIMFFAYYDINKAKEKKALEDKIRKELSNEKKC